MKTLLPVLVAVIALAVACNDEGDESLPMSLPSATHPAATSVAPATVPASTGAAPSVVFLRDDGLWAASLDGSGEPRAITSGSVRAAYAGFAVRPDGGIDLYYLIQLEENQTFDTPVQFGAYRVALEGGQSEELFRFTSNVPHLAGAAVSLDGERIVYADAEALNLRDLDSGDETVLARSRRVLAGDGEYILTGQLTSPLWSPTGEKVYSSMFAGPDTVVSVIIDLPPHRITVADIRFPGYRGSWSPDGSRLCLYSGDIYDGGLTLYDVTTHEQVDVLASGVLPAGIERRQSSVGGCAWSEDGRLAVSYAPIAEEPPRIFILDERLAVVAQSELVDPSGGVIDWLPDGSGIVLARRDPDGASSSAGIYRPGAGIQFLPFEADRVRAVAP